MKPKKHWVCAVCSFILCRRGRGVDKRLAWHLVTCPNAVPVLVESAWE